MSSWVIVGCGYTGRALAQRLVTAGSTVIITKRDPTSATALASELGAAAGWALDLAAPPATDPDAAARAPAGSIVVSCAPPGAEPAAEIAQLLAFARDASKLVYVSSTGVYAPAGGAWVTEAWPLEPVTASGRARLAAERALPASASLLRAAGIYGPGRGIADRLRAGLYRIVGDGRAHISRIHVDDLVEAIIRAGTSPLVGAFNCADDDPAPIAELADAVAAALGVPPPPRVPLSSVSPEVAGMLTADRRIANTRLTHDLGVTLRYPSARSTPAS